MSATARLSASDHTDDLSHLLTALAKASGIQHHNAFRQCHTRRAYGTSAVSHVLALICSEPIVWQTFWRNRPKCHAA